MITKFVWATYTHDGACCLQSVRGVLDLGIDPSLCCVSVQKDFPLADHLLAQLEELKVKVVEGRYTRRNTYFDAVAQLRTIAAAGGDLVWYLDSDVILNDLSMMDEVLQGSYVAAAATWKGCEFSGCSKIITHEAAQAGLKDMLEKNTAGIPHKGMPDDTMVGLVLDALYGADKVLRLPSSVLGWYVFEKNWERMRQCRWIHFGQKGHARALAKGRSVRDTIAAHMEEYRVWRASTTH